MSRDRIQSPILIGLCLCALSAPHTVSAKPLDETAPPQIMVVFENGDTLRALSVEPAGIGMVRITSADRQTRFRAVNRVRRVLDEGGRDRTVEALDRGQVIGSRPRVTYPEEQPPEVSKPPRYGPRSAVRSFSVTETSAFGRVDRTSARDERTFTFSFDFGREFNVSARDALGATAFVGAGAGSSDLGARFHYRRWLGTQSSLDFAPGVIFAHDEPGYAKGRGIGLVGQVAWSNNPWFSVAAQVYSVERSSVTAYGPFGFGAYQIPASRDTGVMLGFKLGGTPGAVAGAGIAIVGLIVAGNHDIKETAPLGL